MMKKLLIMALMACFGTLALADRDRLEGREFERRPHPDARWHGDAGWLIPSIVGGALVYSAINSRPEVIVQPQPQQYYPIQPNQPQIPPLGYHWETILDANCNCQRVVLVRN
jgi:hypothetical protein